jgi:hypothetical protein
MRPTDLASPANNYRSSASSLPAHTANPRPPQPASTALAPARVPSGQPSAAVDPGWGPQPELRHQPGRQDQQASQPPIHTRSFRFRWDDRIVRSGLSSGFALLPAPVLFRHELRRSAIQTRAGEASFLLMRHPI